MITFQRAHGKREEDKCYESNLKLMECKDNIALPLSLLNPWLIRSLCGYL